MMLIAIMYNNEYFNRLLTRGVPIIGSTTILATDMVFFTNIGIGTEQQEDQIATDIYTVAIVCT